MLEQEGVKMAVETVNCIFWGCGNIGKEMLRFWKFHGKTPIYFCDNDRRYWNKKIEGISVIAPEDLHKIKPEKIYITCSNFEAVYEQLRECRIEKERIIRADSISAPQMLYETAEIFFGGKFNPMTDIKAKEGCMIDLSCGMVLGGVERWSYSLACLLKKIGIEGEYLVPFYADTLQIDDTLPVIFYSKDGICENFNGSNSFLTESIQMILQSSYRKIICNFPFEIFQAACIIKKLFLKRLYIIAVLHNDEDIYYEAYTVWKECIDVCLVISKRIKKRLIQKGFPSEKVSMLQWNIREPIDEKKYSSEHMAIRIGYAGRITYYQKRVDLLLELAEKLVLQGIDFVIDIAGSGDYEEILRKGIYQRKLERFVRVKGYIEHEYIFEFWENQDIYISCSEFEGHSISQVEAMAVGVVPVVTNTSGVEDDIIDEENGFIVDIGDTETMAKRIHWLYSNRDKLYEFGSKAKMHVKQNRLKIDEEKFWSDLLIIKK